MIEVYVLFCLALVWIIFAVVQDIRTREIANWLNFSLVIFALGFRFFYSLFSEAGFSFFYQGLIGFGIFFLLGNLFYYSKMFAGGDAKLMMALGAILPIYDNLFSNLKLLFLFLVLFLFIGAVYGLVVSIYFTIKNFNNFKKEFKKQFKERKKLILLLISFACVFLILGIMEQVFLSLGILFFIFPYLYLYVKSVDESCMIRKVDVKKLTLGDWLYKDERMGKELIKADWDGLTEKSLALLKKKKRFVLVRYGIQFAPVFLISFLLFVLFVKLGLLDFFGYTFGF